MHPFDTDSNVEIDSEDENSSDFDNESTEDSSDFIGSLTKLPPEENAEILKSSDIDRTEIISLYKMEGFKNSVEVCVYNHVKFICHFLGGKVWKGDRWIPATKVAIEVSTIKVHYIQGHLPMKHAVCYLFKDTKYHKNENACTISSCLFDLITGHRKAVGYMI